MEKNHRQISNLRNPKETDFHSVVVLVHFVQDAFQVEISPMRVRW